MVLQAVPVPTSVHPFKCQVSVVAPGCTHLVGPGPAHLTCTRTPSHNLWGPRGRDGPSPGIWKCQLTNLLTPEAWSWGARLPLGQGQQIQMPI